MSYLGWVGRYFPWVRVSGSIWGIFFGGWGWVRKNFGWVDWVGVGEDE